MFTGLTICVGGGIVAELPLDDMLCAASVCVCEEAFDMSDFSLFTTKS